MVRQSATPPCANAPAQSMLIACGAGDGEIGVKTGRGQLAVLPEAGASGMANAALGADVAVALVCDAGSEAAGALVGVAGAFACGAAGAGSAAAQPIRKSAATNTLTGVPRHE